MRNGKGSSKRRPSAREEYRVWRAFGNPKKCKHLRQMVRRVIILLAYVKRFRAAALDHEGEARRKRDPPRHLMSVYATVHRVGAKIFMLKVKKCTMHDFCACAPAAL